MQGLGRNNYTHFLSPHVDGCGHPTSFYGPDLSTGSGTSILPILYHYPLPLTTVSSSINILFTSLPTTDFRSMSRATGTSQDCHRLHFLKAVFSRFVSFHETLSNPHRCREEVPTAPPPSFVCRVGTVRVLSGPPLVIVTSFV